ncbi:MAG: amidohydrolase family protein [Lachnospiraceae bacterium]|nr:amidohydrolase family protein [Lachnospiraceae bacterium]
MLDILIRGGWVVDGTGNPRRRCDVGVCGGRIVSMDRCIKEPAKETICAEGLTVSPGFIDAHSHSDVTIGSNPYCESTIRQGVTTEIVGNCGDSTAPFPPEGGGAGGGFGRFGDDPIPYGRTLGEHMEELERVGMSGNLAWLTGHNSLRALAGVKGPDVTEEQYQKMEQALRQAFEDGAVGMSSGLEFEPGRASRPEELMRLAGVVKEYGGIYTSHIRNRDAHVLEALDEFLAVIRHHHIRGQVSHMNIRYHTHAPEQAVQKCMEKIRQARAEGYEVLTDMTPLDFGIGQMAGILPSWLTQMPADQLKAALSDPDIRERLRDDHDRYWRFIAGGEWERVRMQDNKAFPEINGLTFPEIAALWDKDPWDCYLDILAAVAPDIDSVVLVSRLFTEEHLAETISDPLYMLVVDGYSTSAEGEVARHTRFPLHYIGMDWFLTHHVRERHILSLEEAVRKMTSMPAAHFDLKDRGLLREGGIADITVFDYDHMETPFDLRRPAQYARGVRYVLVNGVPVLYEGEHLHTTPGKNIRRTYRR